MLLAVDKLYVQVRSHSIAKLIFRYAFKWLMQKEWLHKSLPQLPESAKLTQNVIAQTYKIEITKIKLSPTKKCE